MAGYYKGENEHKISSGLKKYLVKALDIDRYIDHRNIDNLYKREMQMSESISLISGSTSMLLLSLLSAKDMYGYEMIEALHQRSTHVFDLKAGTL